MIYFELFYIFFLIGLFTFGGGYAMIPMIQDQVVGKGWMSEAQLTDFIAISETTPGPFAINISTFIGSQTGGILGAICATIGVILPSFIIILIVSLILSKFLNNRFVKGALNGVKPIVLALILSTALLLLIRIIVFNGNSLYSVDAGFDIKALSLLIILGGFIFIYHKITKKGFNPILLLALSGLFGLILFS